MFGGRPDAPLELRKYWSVGLEQDTIRLRSQTADQHTGSERYRLRSTDTQVYRLVFDLRRSQASSATSSDYGWGPPAFRLRF